MEMASSSTSEQRVGPRSWTRDLVAVSLWAVLLIALVRLGHDHAGSGSLHHGAPAVGLGRVFASWAVMTAVMMLPTSIPVLRALDDLLANRRGSGLRGRFDLTWWSFVAGYVGLWLGYAAIAASLQVAFARSGVVGVAGELRSTALAGGALAVAGVYQFTSWKQACLTGCTRPMTFFMVHWRDGAAGGLRMGSRHAVTCIGCCWALMGLAFVGGIQSMWFMVIATALMVVEKLPAVGERVRVPIGALLVVGAISVWVGWIG